MIYATMVKVTEFNEFVAKLLNHNYIAVKHTQKNSVVRLMNFYLLVSNFPQR